MILIDTSVWVEHLRDGNAALAQLLDDAAVLAHPWVTGEIALGSLRQRDEIIVATMLLASRIPFRKSKIRAKTITIMSSWDIISNRCRCEERSDEAISKELEDCFA